MKRLVIICSLFILVACAHHEPIATPEEVNDYLDRIAERSMFDLLDQVNNDNVII